MAESDIAAMCQTQLMEYKFALVGTPVRHSLSPVMHQAALEHHNLDGSYELVDCDEAGFRAIVSSLRNGNLFGLNVTMPYKDPAFSECDGTTPLADSVGAVNTMRCHGDKILGHNTDVEAFRILFESGRFGDSPLAILGSGATAAAALAASVGPVTIATRNPSKSDGLLLRFPDRDIEIVDLFHPVDQATVVNATPLGMNAEALPSGWIDAASGLIDLPYGSTTTPAVRAARRGGFEYCDGYEFLSLQAAASFRWWTGLDVDAGLMEQAARNA